MKQFILATSVVTSKPSSVAAAGTDKLSIYEENGMFNLLVGHGTNVPTDLLVIDKKNLEVTVTNHTAAATFSQTITIPSAPVQNVDYAIQITKNGAVFNERNVWTTSVTKTATAGTANLMAAKLAKQINMMTNTTGLKATVSSAVVTVTALQPGVDYTLKSIVEGPGVTSSTAAAALGSKTKGTPGIADVAYIKELAHKCIGDKGIEYTHIEAAIDTYHAYNNEGNKVTDTINAIVNVRCYNPRYDHRIDEPLNQMIHIACTADNATIIANTLQGVSASSDSSDE